MVARVTLAEIDTLRIRLEDAVEHFREVIVPPLEQQPGYRGVYALSTPEGSALVMTLWEDEAAADEGLASGFYAGQLERALVDVAREPFAQRRTVGGGGDAARGERGVQRRGLVGLHADDSHLRRQRASHHADPADSIRADGRSTSQARDDRTINVPPPARCGESGW